MLAPEMVAKFHDFGKPDPDVMSSNPDLINSQPSSWSKRDFSSDDESHNSFMTSSIMAQNTVTSPMASSMQESQLNLVPNITKQDLSPNFLSPDFLDSKVSSVMTSDTGDVSNMTQSQSELIVRDICHGCHNIITDRFVHQISGRAYHEECSRCSACGRSLTSSCFVKGGKLFCKEDYLRVRKICTGCDSEIRDGEMVMRLMTSCNVYHVTCFKCSKCNMNLKKGDKYIVNSECNNNGESGITCQRCWEGCHDVMNMQDFDMTSQDDDDLNEDENVTSVTENSDETAKSESNELSGSTISSTNANSTSSSNCDIIDLMTSPRSHSSVASPKSDDMGELSDDDDKEMTSSNDATAMKDDLNDKDDCNDKDDGESGDKRPKRPRTILNAVQRRAFKAAFEMSPKPCRKVREALASETGLTVRVVQVWFQNQRAKMKKLAKRQQSREQAMALKAREQFGFHGYEHMTSLPHPPIFPHHDGTMEPGYGNFPPRPHDVAIWERMHGQPQPAFQHHGYPESLALHSHEHMSQMDNLSPSRFNDYPVYASQAMIGESRVDHTFPQPNHLTPMTNAQMNQPMRTDDLGTPIDGLYSMQNNYFTS